MGQAWAAYEARDFDRLYALYHPHARQVTVASGGEVLNAEETAAAAAGAARESAYELVAGDPEAIDDRAGFFQGRVRYRRPTGGTIETELVWLYTELDGLLYRGVVYHDLASALDAYAEHGVSLGIPD